MFKKIKSLFKKRYYIEAWWVAYRWYLKDADKSSKFTFSTYWNVTKNIAHIKVKYK